MPHRQIDSYDQAINLLSSITTVFFGTETIPESQCEQGVIGDGGFGSLFVFAWVSPGSCPSSFFNNIQCSITRGRIMRPMRTLCRMAVWNCTLRQSPASRSHFICIKAR